MGPPAGTPLVHGGPTLHTLVGAAGAVRPVEVKPAWARGPSARIRVRSKLLGLAGVRGEQVQGVASHLLHSCHLVFSSWIKITLKV